MAKLGRKMSRSHRVEYHVRKRGAKAMLNRRRVVFQPWLIPMLYVIGAAVGGIALPRAEYAWQTDAKFRLFELSASSAQAYLSAAASGMMALTGIVFAMGFVMVERGRLLAASCPLVGS